jgi:hypothetical protein
LLPGSHRCCNLSAEEEAAHRDQHDCEMMRMAAAPLLLAFMRFHPWRTQLFVCALLLPFFLCWGFPSGSLRLMLMVDFPIRCNRSRAYGRDSCCCVIAAPEKHTPRSDISPQGPIFCHSCGLFSIMMEMGESCFESLLLCHPLPKHHQAWYRTRHPSPSSCSKGSLLDSFETSSPTPFPREVWLGSIIAFSEKECSRLWSRDRTHGMMF